MTAVQELGKALSDASLKGSTFVVAGHTDAIGGEAYNQDLSERRADTIKKYLTEKYGITGSDLVTVGYGKTKPKDANAPMDPANRRVQVVNMDTKTGVEVRSPMSIRLPLAAGGFFCAGATDATAADLCIYDLSRIS